MNVLQDSINKGRKYDQVLDGARKVFLADGFEGASVDDIAKAAGVSKATLYSYFPDKRLLFSEVVRVECRSQAEQAMAEIDQNAPVGTVLRAAAAHMVGLLLSDFAQSVYRICVGEAARFPELGREFYDSGPRAGKDAIAAFLGLAVSRGELNIDDIDLAAYQFAELCKADIFLKRVFGVRTEFSQNEIDRVIDGAVTMFLARYGV
jgi:AcrR family transcriptional regulator